MRRTPSRTLAFLIACVAACAPCPRAGAESPIRVTVQAEARRMGEQNWGFQVEGSVNLPDEANVRIELLYQKQVKSPPRIARTGKPFVTEEVSVDETSATVARGKFSASLAFFSYEPYAGDYVVVVTVPAEAQPEAVARFLSGVGEVPEHRHAFRHGQLEDVDRQRKAVEEVIRMDMIALHRLQREAQERFESLYGRPEPQLNELVGALGTGGWDTRFGELQARNQLRCAKDLFWKECYGRRYIDMLLSDLRGVVGKYKEALELPGEKRPLREKVLEYAMMFDDTYFMWMEYLQFPPPKDVTEALRALRDLRGMLTEFARWHDGTAAAPPNAADARAKVMEWQGKTLAALATLTQALPDFEFAPMTTMTRDITRVLRDASRGLAAGDTVARERVPDGLAKILVALDQLEKKLQ